MLDPEMIHYLTHATNSPALVCLQKSKKIFQKKKKKNINKKNIYL
jgi:hypothetical protein